jgi:superfamily II DNA/RNA helicase
LDQIEQRLSEAQLESLVIHGSLSQSARIKLMNQANTSKIIIASDLLARGIDFKLDLVILFDAKRNDTFWHRIGRTGRFGRTGVVISLDNIEDWDLYDPITVQEHLSLVDEI